MIRKLSKLTTLAHIIPVTVCSLGALPQALCCDGTSRAVSRGVYVHVSPADSSQGRSVVVSSSMPVDPRVEQARAQVALAKQAFRAQRLAEALSHIERVSELLPQDADARHFRSFIYFAMADYQQSAAEAYDALLLGPTWTWSAVSNLYADPSTYTSQLRRLEAAARANSDSLEAHFLLAYHYLTLGHLSEGQRQLERVLEIRPDEPVAEQLLGVVRQLRTVEVSRK